MVSETANFFRDKTLIRGGWVIISIAIILLFSAPGAASEPSAAHLPPLLNAVNKFRVDHGRRPLTLDFRLTRAAESQAVYSARTGLLDHSGHLGLNLGKRLDGVDYRWSHAGENLAAGQRDAAEVIEHWSDSPSHRRVLLGEAYWEAGVAMVKSDEGTYYWVLITATQLVRQGDE